VPAPLLFIGLIAPWLAATGAGVLAPGASTVTELAPVVWTPVPQRGLVIVLRPPDADETTRIALARVTGELAAARFRVTVLPLDPNQEPKHQVESIAPEANPVAVFAIAHITDPEGDTIAIWVCDRVGRRTAIQRMATRGDNIRQDAEVLALQAIELIRVSIGGLWPAPRGAAASPSKSTMPSTPPPPPRSETAPAAQPPSRSTTPPAPAAPPTAPAAATVASEPAEPAPAPPPPPESAVPSPATAGARPEVSVGLGVAALRDAAAPSMQWMGALTAVARWPGGFAARASFAGLGSSVTLSGLGGTAELHEQLATLGAAWFLSTGGPAAFYGALALGAVHVAVSGAATDPGRAGRTDGAWASIGSAGLGTQVRLGDRISVGAGIDLVWPWSRLDVQVGDTRTSAALRPGALLSLTLQASF
jgi:hypothetical protein